MKHSGVSVFFKIVVVLVTAGFGAAAQAAVVNMNVNASQTGLEVTTPGACSGSNHPGCIRASGRDPITFNLTGNRTCSAGGNWELDHVALGTVNKSVGNISAVAASDFNANASSGIVTPNNQSTNQILMRNNNTAAYTVWYTVYARCGDSVINTDPRLENDGSGRN